MFDGVNDYFEEASKSSTYNFAAGENVYIETWINTNSISRISSFLATQNAPTNTSDTGFNFAVLVGGNITLFWIDDTNGAQQITSPNTSRISVNTWNHIVLIRDSGVWTYVINGVSYIPGLFGGAPNSEIVNTNCNGGLLVGSRMLASFSRLFFDGKIAKVIISNNVPPISEIQRRAAEPCKVKKGEYQNVRGAWLFQNPGSPLVDISSNGINLPEVNNPTYQVAGPC